MQNSSHLNLLCQNYLPYIPKRQRETAEEDYFYLVLSDNVPIYYLICCRKFYLNRISGNIFHSTIISLFKTIYVILFAGVFNFIIKLLLSGK